MRELPTGMRVKVLAAAGLFAEYGLDATKMEDIAAATGVPKATLYYYFAGKEDILTFLFSEILDEIASAIEEALRTEGTGGRPTAGGNRGPSTHLRGVPGSQPGPAVRPRSGCSHATHRRANRSGLPWSDPPPSWSRVPQTAAFAQSNTHGLIAVAILGAVTTVGINAISLGQYAVAPGHRRRCDRLRAPRVCRQ